jgi:hypothetical protein
MAKSGAVARACSQSRSVPTGIRERRANSDCDRPRPVLVWRIRRALAPLQRFGRGVEIFGVGGEHDRLFLHLSCSYSLR